MGPWPGHAAEVPGGPAGLAGPSARLEAWLLPSWHAPAREALAETQTLP